MPEPGDEVCPACGAGVSGWTSADPSAESTTGPEAGGVAVCIACSTVLVLDQVGGPWRAPVGMEQTLLASHPAIVHVLAMLATFRREQKARLN